MPEQLRLHNGIVKARTIKIFLVIFPPSQARMLLLIVLIFRD